MFRLITPISAFLLLAACSDPHPFDFGTPGTTIGAISDETTGTTTDEAAEDTGTLDVGVTLPDGTASPVAAGSIFRFEAPDVSGGGLVTSVTYNSVDDEFTIDNLGFDGDNVYERGIVVGTLGEDLQQYAVYSAADIAYDALDNDPIDQNGPYRAIIGVSDNLVDGEPRTAFAIVRTGGYVDYGFGGFIYERNGGVSLPIAGQAHFEGEYAGIRVFQGRSGLELTTGDIEVDIDFGDFNVNDAVNGTISNRLAFEVDGTPIATGGAEQLLLPEIYFTVVEGAATLTDDGEIYGTLSNTVDAEVYESGTYYGIMSGGMTTLPGGELVGIFVVESEDPRYVDVFAQETGGFILYR